MTFIFETPAEEAAFTAAIAAITIPSPLPPLADIHAQIAYYYWTRGVAFGIALQDTERTALESYRAEDRA